MNTLDANIILFLRSAGDSTPKQIHRSMRMQAHVEVPIFQLSLLETQEACDRLLAQGKVRKVGRHLRCSVEELLGD